ncbi:hypothetical protein FN846DRAFT_892442 [Sphaerosporella brunnea]|uniref:Uncharacterized protein n=1 Tax=Sphaerosporella brunnea TaxID=1250544 RepID=A0A5J5EPK5_9PEZI|nr:hypothetical protein FN846DRAFT_892442 [Sphaerosporella brunnea]
MAPLIVLTTGGPQPDRQPPPSPQLEGAATPGQDAKRSPQGDNNQPQSTMVEVLVECVTYLLETCQRITSRTLSSQLSGAGKYSTGLIVACAVVTFALTIVVVGMRRVQQNYKEYVPNSVVHSDLCRLREDNRAQQLPV